MTFSERSNIFFGNNGSGKTNILESISLLSKGRGFRNSNIENLIRRNEKEFYIETILYENNIDYNIKISSQKKNQNYKKIILLNDENSKETKKFLDDSISLLFFLPEMERLFLSSPSFRRNFIDKLIFSEQKSYNKLINTYKKNLVERNKILQIPNFDKSWIDIKEGELCDNALNIYKLRLNQLNIINENLNIINQNNEYPFNITLKIQDKIYDKNLNKDKYLNYLNLNRDYDAKFGGSKIGPHKSDIVATINNEIDASQLSTGQQKTVILMILFAQCNYLVNMKKIKPLLLFDEICSHLDDINRNILLNLINNFNLQFFLTGTDKSLFSFMSTKSEFYNISEL